MLLLQFPTHTGTDCIEFSVTAKIKSNLLFVDEVLLYLFPYKFFHSAF